jgi:hypothetical protein
MSRPSNHWRWADVVFGKEVCYSRGDVPRKTICLKLNIKIRGVDFTVNLTVLEYKGIDSILGIDWSRKDKGLTNCATKAIKLSTDNRNKLEYVVQSITSYGQRNKRPPWDERWMPTNYKAPQLWWLVHSSSTRKLDLNLFLRLLVEFLKILFRSVWISRMRFILRG